MAYRSLRIRLGRGRNSRSASCQMNSNMSCPSGCLFRRYLWRRCVRRADSKRGVTKAQAPHTSSCSRFRKFVELVPAKAVKMPCPSGCLFRRYLWQRCVRRADSGRAVIKAQAPHTASCSRFRKLQMAVELAPANAVPADARRMPDE